MNEYERQRLMNLVRNWVARVPRSLADRAAFYAGIDVVLETRDGLFSEQIRSILFDVNAILMAEPLPEG